MDRREFVKGSLMGGVGVALESTKESKGKGGGKTKDTRSWKVSNKHVEIELSGDTNGGLASFVDIESRRNFVVSTPRPLYQLLLFQKGKEPVELSSQDAESLKVERSSAPGKEVVTLTYGRHRSLDLGVTCTVTLEADSPLSQWRIAVRNNTSYGIRAIRFPVMVAPAILGESEEDDYYISGSWGSRIVHKPGHRQPAQIKGQPWTAQRFGSQYPGPLALQLQAYYDQTAGLYMATYDNGGNIKRFGSIRLEDGLALMIEHNYDEKPGLSFELPYDTILGVFHGDWYAAADIYKEWAHQQHWCAKKVVERSDLPDWLKEPRPYLVFASAGPMERLRTTLPYNPADYPNGRFWPAKKVVPIMRAYASIFGTPVVTFMEGWEGIGAPGGPVGIFPPLEGEETFKAAMAELTRDGNHPLMYLAAFHWVYKMPQTGYNDWGRFEREGTKMAVIDDQGKLAKEDRWESQKRLVQLCVGSRDTQDLYFNNFMKLMDLGSVGLQMDQQLGFVAAQCYSDQHDHTPGYGPWMYKKTLEFIRRVRGEAKRRNTKAMMAVEAPCEIWIQELDIPFHRPYRLDNIPLFDYIYHEYSPAFGGDFLLGLCHPEVSLMKHAMICVIGLQNCVVVGEEEYNYEVNPNYPSLTLLRNIFEAQRTYAHDYLVLGQMLRPTELKGSTETVDRYMAPGTVDVPRVVHGVWRSPQGKIGYVLVNWSSTSEVVTLRLVNEGETTGKKEVLIVSAKERRAVPQSEVDAGHVRVTVPPRSVLLVQQG